MPKPLVISPQMDDFINLLKSGKFPHSHKDMAAYLGITSKTLSERLRRLRKTRPAVWEIWDRREIR